MSVCNNVSGLLFLCIFLVKMNLLKFLLSTRLNINYGKCRLMSISCLNLRTSKTVIKEQVTVPFI